MKNKDQLKLVVNNFRAVGKAEIALNGITVVAGENGSGKSTLSKLLYHTFRVSRDFEKLFIELIALKLAAYSETLRSIAYTVHRISTNENKYFNPLKLKATIVRDTTIDDIENDYNKVLDEYSYWCSTFVNETSIDKIEVSASEQLMNTFSKITQTDFWTTKEKIANCNEALVKIADLREKTDAIFNDVKHQLFTKNIEILKRQLYIEFGNQDVIESFQITDNDINIIDNNRFNHSSTISDVIYIDSPFATELQEFEHWRALQAKLKQTPDYDTVTTFKSHIIQGFGGEKALNGNVYFNNDNSESKFKFKHDDGREFALSECATGIKAFGILQMLYTSGSLTNETLVILDEPEVHLHPQWIVEYARMIVMLNKELGVKFFIASHSPAMVSAIKHISKKNGTDNDNNLNFYLAVKNGENYQYSFKSSGVDISEIFASFNRSYDRIEEYGDDE